jgi:23S rRNA pseudouridine2605 synthase
VFDLLPGDWGHLFTIGRLDADSEGLILLTNDGEFCQKVAHPRHGMLKTYRVSLAKRVNTEALKTLTNGLRDNGEWLQAKRAKLLAANNTRSEVELVLAEGKNREIRRMFKALGHRVLRLQRIAVGPVKLGELPLGKWRVLSQAEIASCLRSGGKTRESHRRN